MKDPLSPSEFTYHPLDLFETFVKHFYPRGIIGGMKGQAVPGGTDWITHGRFLLTRVTDGMLADLFRHPKWWSDKEGERNFLEFGTYSAQVAAYLVGILRKRQFLPEILQLLAVAQSDWHHTGSLIALFLMRGEATLQAVRELEMDPACKAGAEIALKLLAADNIEDYLGERGKKQVLLGAEMARRLYAGYEFETARELQGKLARLLSISTPPELAMKGLLSCRQVRLRGSLVTTSTSIQVVQLNAVPRKVDGVQAIHWTFTQAVQDHLRQGVRGRNLGPLVAAAISSHFPQDLLGGLEADWQYCLPAQVVQVAFERLLKLLPASDCLYEAYAYALLVRGNENDAQARRLLEQAARLQEEFSWVMYRFSSRYPVAPHYKPGPGETLMPEKGSQVILNQR